MLLRASASRLVRAAVVVCGCVSAANPVHALTPAAAQAQAKAAIESILNQPQKRKLGAGLDPSTSQQQSQSAYVNGLAGRPVTVQQLSATLLAGTAPIYATLMGMGTWTNGVYRAGDTALLLGQAPATVALSGKGSDLTSPVPASLLPSESALLDQLGSTPGSILYRGNNGWALLPPGASGYLLASGGQASNPSFVPPSSVQGNVTLVPTRVVTGTSAASSSPADYLIVLNGPLEVDLEQSPPVGTTHVLVDGRAQAGSSIKILASSSDTINNASSLFFTQTGQAMTITYTSLGWKYY